MINHSGDEGGYTLAQLEALEAAGKLTIIQPGTPEADAFDQAMTAALQAQDDELRARDGPDAMTSDRVLRQAALTAEQDPAYLAAAFATFRARLGLDLAGLAAWLKVGPDQLAALAICHRPDPLSPTFADEVARLADQFGADPGRLLEALR